MCNGLGYIIPIVIFSILYNISKFFEIETLSIKNEEWILSENGTNISTVVFYPIYNGTALRWDPVYSKYVVFVLNFVIMGESVKHYVLFLLTILEQYDDENVRIQKSEYHR